MNHHKYKLLFILFIVSIVSFGQQNNELFQGGCSNDYASSAIIDNSKNVYIVGGSSSFDWSPDDIYLIKNDSSMYNKWAKTFRYFHFRNVGLDIASYNDTSLLILGRYYTQSYGKTFLMLVDTSGSILMKKNFYHVWKSNIAQCDYNKLFKTQDSNIIIYGAAQTNEDTSNIITKYGPIIPSIVKMDPNGNIIKSKVLYIGPDSTNGTPYFSFSSINENKDSTYIVIGTTYWPNYTFVVKLDKNLNVLWHKVYGKLCLNTGNILESTDGSFIGCGVGSDTLLYNRMAYIFKLDSSGNLIWYKLLDVNNDVSSISGSTVKLFPSFNNTYFVLATMVEDYSNHSYKYTLFKINSNGDIIWAKKYGDDNFSNISQSLIKVDSNNYKIIGTTNSNLSGNLLSPYGHHDDIHIFSVDSNGVSSVQNSNLNYVISSYNVGQINYPIKEFDLSLISDTFTLKEEIVSTTYDSISCIGVSIKESDNSSSLNVFPNPTSGSIAFELKDFNNEEYKLSVFDYQGKIVLETKIHNQNKFNIDLSNFDSGIYFYRLTNLVNGKSNSGKLIKL
ncbi:MAG: T9SS type A sorting domain-containing protein [Saprospiraceae bacterium]|nr:T9SS type A sorting domain-containing protein [Saprospiraceae bacterium]